MIQRNIIVTNNDSTVTDRGRHFCPKKISPVKIYMPRLQNSRTDQIVIRSIAFP